MASTLSWEVAMNSTTRDWMSSPPNSTSIRKRVATDNNASPSPKAGTNQPQCNWQGQGTTYGLPHGANLQPERNTAQDEDSSSLCHLVTLSLCHLVNEIWPQVFSCINYASLLCLASNTVHQIMTGGKDQPTKHQVTSGSRPPMQPTSINKQTEENKYKRRTFKTCTARKQWDKRENKRVWMWKDQPILGWVNTASKDQAGNLSTHRHEKQRDNRTKTNRGRPWHRMRGK